MSELKPLCFVLMPFGEKPDPAGRPPIDFDRIYGEAINLAVRDAGMIPVRADEERTGGVIHKIMFERLLLCEYAVADLTTANANVFYELGVRHTARPATTLAIFATHQPIPFDVGFMRALPYDLGEGNRFGEEQAAALRAALAERLEELRRIALQGGAIDSPLFQLLGEWRPREIARLKTDVFRERAEITSRYKERLSQARRAGDLDALRSLQTELGGLDLGEAGVIVDLLLSYRAVGAWNCMVELCREMPVELRRQVLVREQLAFALNRRAGEEGQGEDRERALEILESLETERGPSSETCGLIGRIYKDRWDAARRDEPRLARGYLAKSIAAYRRGFSADSRDAYPGVNAVTLLDVRGDPASLEERDRLLPVVRFAAEQRIAGRSPDYWDHATLLELAVLGSDQDRTDVVLDDCLSAAGEHWQPETTARNLSLVSEHRTARGEDSAWIEEIIRELDRCRSRLAPQDARPSRRQD